VADLRERDELNIIWRRGIIFVIYF
jgi:hypothetical protein